MIKVNTSGFDKLQRDLKDASEAIARLDGDITKLVFTNFDPSETGRAIHQMETAIDEKVGRFRSNPLIKPLIERVKEHFRQRILEKSSSHRNSSVGETIDSEESVNPAVEKKRKQRFEYMNALYEATDGHEQAFIDMAEIGMKIGLSRDECLLTVEYLKGEGLLKHVSLGGIIAITHLGVIEVETALQKPSEPTAHFPAVQNIINIHSMNDSVIQQGNFDSVQNVSVSRNSLGEISTFIEAFRKDLDQFALSTEQKAEVNAEIRTVEAQLESPKPRISVIAGALKFLVSVAEKVAASVVAPHVQSALPMIHAFLLQHS